MKVPKIVSGGQTGIDRAALDWAISHHLPHGGWCPKGRHAEDGIIPFGYELQETPSEDSRQRTEWNVRDSDATLIFTCTPKLTRGCLWTAECARLHRKPCLHLFPGLHELEELKRFLEAHVPQVLNVAGQRESEAPGLGNWAGNILEEVFFVRNLSDDV